MKEIEFRGESLGSGEWVFGSLCRAKNIDFIVIGGDFMLGDRCGRERLISENFHRVRRRTVGLYTGLKDRNGVKIFLNDIIKIDGFGIAEVIFKVGNFVVKRCDGFPVEDSLGGCGDTFKTTEVIGNRHDNPEMLKEYKNAQRKEVTNGV